MKTILLLISIIFNPVILLAADTQTYIEFKYISKDIQTGSFDDSIRKLWRAGKYYARFEEAPDPSAGIHGLMIINAPNSYLINLYTKTANQIVDPGPSIDVHVPVFQGEQSEELAKLEMGYELEFFRDRNASHMEDEVVDGIRCSVYKLRVEDYSVKLFLKNTTNEPYQLSIVTPMKEYAVRYLRYSIGEKFDKNLYSVPDGIKIDKTK